MLLFQKATKSYVSVYFSVQYDFDFGFMKVVLCKALFIIIKANSSYYVDQGW